MKLLFFITVVVCISLFTLYPTFNLALFGDDWLAFFRFLQHLGPKSSGEWNYLTYFLTPYGAQDILMGELQKIFGYQTTPYFILSFSLRLIAAFSLYPLVSYLTKNKPATFLAVLFFSITTTGLDTTNWVFNMPTYITIALFNLCLYLFFRSWTDQRIVLLIISGLLYYLSYVITPIRMHGSLPLIILLQAFLWLQDRNLKSIKKSLFRLGLFLLIFAVIRYTGDSQGPPQEAGERISQGISSMITLLQNGQLSFLTYPLVMFGSMLIPDFILPLMGRNIVLFLTGVTIIASAIFLIIKSSNKSLSAMLFLGLSWSILSFFFAWWWTPTSIFPSTYRYLIPSAGGISILMAGIIALGKSKTQQRLLSTIFFFLIFLHIISTRIYINYLVAVRGQDINTKIWDSIPKIAEIGRSKEPMFFYFEGDGTNEAILHDVITFGFPPHMALIYNLREEDGGIPIPITSWQEVISITNDGQTLPRYGYPIKPISYERIYAFRLSGRDNLINITDLARKKLLSTQ